MMSPLHQNPELMAAIHTDRLRRLRQQSRPRRDSTRADDRRWG
jgi:hypothetical protein